MTRAILLFGHGSRDPLWREPMDAVAARISARSPDVRVACAFLEMQGPDLGTAVRQLADAGATDVSIVPMFLGTGRHARDDLPGLVKAARVANPGVAIRAAPAVGEWPAVLDLLAEEALKRS